jgi:hypothetical protein
MHRIDAGDALGRLWAFLITLRPTQFLDVQFSLFPQSRVDRRDPIRRSLKLPGHVARACLSKDEFPKNCLGIGLSTDQLATCLLCTEEVDWIGYTKQGNVVIQYKTSMSQISQSNHAPGAPSVIQDDDEVPLDLSEQTNRPVDDSFHQQRIQAWHPILDPVWVIVALFYLGIILVPVGKCCRGCNPFLKPDRSH